MERRKTKEISVGGVKIGGGAPVSIQSMTNTQTDDVRATVAQINELSNVGCEIVRIAVPDRHAAAAIPEIIKGTEIPLIADIHFDYRLALSAIKGGIHGLRLNPGNIGSRERIGEVVRAAKESGISIRIGVNAGSLESDILEKHGHPVPEALVESAMRHIEILEDMDFGDIKVALKASDVWTTVKSYRLLAEKVDYPFHIGITEAGTLSSGTVKSAVGLGILLAEGIGDTMRVSLTAPPTEEVRVGWEILKSLGMRERGIDIVSCPTCGRIKIDCITIATEIERRLAHISEPVKVAVMGCVVNGPGEAVESDVGVAGGDSSGMIYVKGEAVGRVGEARIIESVVAEVESLVAKGEKADISIVAPVS